MSGRGERTARVLVAAAVAGLLLLALWPTLRPAPAAAAAPDWVALAPDASVSMRAWRSLHLVAAGQPAHLRLAPAPGEAARIETLGAWRLQQPVAGRPKDAVVVAVVGGADERLAVLTAELLRRIPTLGMARISADPGLGLDVERLRYLARGHLAR